MSDLLCEGVLQQPTLLLKTQTGINQEKVGPPKENSDSPLGLLHQSQISPVYHEPYIVDGYRKPGTSFLNCIRYTLVLHNDVGNFWTHFIPLFIWIPWFFYLAKYSIDFTEPYNYPLVCFWVGSCSYAFFSSIAHMCSCISFEVRSICFILDYMGISMYTLGGGLIGFFHHQSLKSSLYDYKYYIVMLEVCFSINGVLFCGLSRFYWKRYRFVIRILSFFLPYVAAVFPFLQRLSACIFTGNKDECVYQTLHLHLICLFLTFSLSFAFVTKIPERFYPGKFDFFFQSHQIFHIIAAIQTTIQMYMLPLDAQLRRDALSQVEGTSPDFYSSFLPFILAEVFGLLTVAVLGRLVVTGVLTSNKDDPKKVL